MTQKNINTHPTLFREQLFILLSVTPELLCQFHLAVDGLGQILGQDVLTRLRRTRQDERLRHKWILTLSLSKGYVWTRILHMHQHNTEWLSDSSHWVQFFRLQQLAAQTPEFLLQLWSLLERILCLCLQQLSLQLVHLQQHQNNSAYLHVETNGLTVTRYYINIKEKSKSGKKLIIRIFAK